MSVLTEIKRLGQQLSRQGIVLTGWAAADKMARWVTGGPVERFSKISENIWLGGQPTPKGLQRLFEQGFTGIINMRAEHDYARITNFGSVKYLYLPTEDNESPSLENLVKGVGFIHGQGSEGKTYIHCWEGLGRGPTMVAAYYVSIGLQPDEAWDMIRVYRPFIRPTDNQMERLQEFYRRIGIYENEKVGSA